MQTTGLFGFQGGFKREAKETFSDSFLPTVKVPILFVVKSFSHYGKVGGKEALGEVKDGQHLHLLPSFQNPLKILLRGGTYGSNS